MSDINTEGLTDEIHTTAVMVKFSGSVAKNSLIVQELVKGQESFYAHAFFHR